jgi:hypothetical protein
VRYYLHEGRRLGNAKGEAKRAVARDSEVSQTTVQLIVERRTWTHVA